MAVAGFLKVLNDGELVACGATHLVQMVLVLVLKIVEILVVFKTAVVPFVMWVLVTGQVV